MAAADSCHALARIGDVSTPEPLRPESDSELVKAARLGDHRSFDSLYARYSRMVHGILLSRVPSSEAEDLVQDVFFAAWRRLATLRDSNAFGGWLAMIARNRAADYHREARPTLALPDELASSNPPHLEAASVLETIRSLPEAYRETMILRLVEGMTGPEIAVQTGLTPDSVRVNLHRGMKLLRAALGMEARP